MLITFKSKAAANILMEEQQARRMLDLLGKDVAHGIITAAETADAIRILEQEISAERVQSPQHADADVNNDPGEDGKEEDSADAAPVSFATRAYPLLEMLRAASAQHQSVMWGV